MNEASYCEASPPSRESVFDLWSEVYDDQPNPLLMLEERVVLPLLPPLSGCNVLDVGCGTGRWLVRLETLKPASLVGTDVSPAMLRRCREKALPATRLHLSRSSSGLPGTTGSYSLIISSFVVSYLDDLNSFAKECARILQPGGSVLLSDMHPQTAKDLGWSRSFRNTKTAVERTIEIEFNLHTLQEIISTFETHGFTLTRQLEPSFGITERSIFEATGKLADFDALLKTPAIYILKFRRNQRGSNSAPSIENQSLQITGISCALDPLSWGSVNLNIEDGRISSFSSGSTASTLTLDLSEYSLLPGLVNAHDHLDFGLFPRIGRNPDEMAYQNATEWAAEIHLLRAETIRRHLSIPKNIRLWWGAIRNLLCGVTTVCHHNPIYADLQQPEFLLHVVERFGWAHSLAFEPQLSNTFRGSSKNDPFILHAAEGLDSAAKEEILELDRLNILDSHTVLIHGLGLTPETLKILNHRGTALVVCPTSSQFLFGQVLSRDILASVQRLAVGSDSSLTSEGDLLDELAFLRSHYHFDELALHNMVTTNPATILRLSNGEGQIREGGVADLIAVRGQNSTPAATISRLGADQVELVLLSGRVQMASETIYKRLPDSLRNGMEALYILGHKRWIRAPLHKLFSQAEDVLGKGNLYLSGRKVQYAGSL